MKTAILCGKLFNSADASISEHALVLIENGKITDVRTGTAAPEGYETVDLSGLFVMNGYTDWLEGFLHSLSFVQEIGRAHV